MKTATVSIKGISPYSQSKHYTMDKEPGENSADYEKRTWRNRLHSDASGNVFIPPMALKNSISEAAKFLSIQVPGKGKATYTKHFESGLLVLGPITLPIKVAEVAGEELFVPADGVRGSGKRVVKVFPVIQSWGGSFQIIVMDETVLNEHAPTKTTVLEHVVREAGKFIGLGRFRPRNNGFYGRFEVTDFKIS